MLTRKKLAGLGGSGVVLVAIGWLLTQSTAAPPPPSSPTVIVSPTAEPSPYPDGHAFSELFLKAYGDFDGNREVYATQLRPLVTDQFALFFFEKQAYVDNRLRRSSELVSLRKSGGDEASENYVAVLKTTTLVTGEPPLEARLQLRLYLVRVGAFWKVSDMQFELAGSE